MRILDLVNEAHRTATDKGWWDDYERDQSGCVVMTPDQVAAKLALIHSEVSEALEALRDGDTELRIGEGGKPEGMPSELADVVIRIGDLCGALGIDLEDAVERKMAFNRTRPKRHGGKAL